MSDTVSRATANDTGAQGRKGAILLRFGLCRLPTVSIPKGAGPNWRLLHQPMPLSPAKDSAETPVTVRVRLFASLREAMGWGERLVTPDAAKPTPLALWRQLNLTGAWPLASHADEGLPRGVRVAINQRFAHADTPLADGDELAFLPPITGG